MVNCLYCSFVDNSQLVMADHIKKMHPYHADNRVSIKENIRPTEDFKKRPKKNNFLDML